MKRYLFYNLLIIIGFTFSSCKDEKLFTLKEPPRPQVTFSFTDASGKSPRLGGNTFMLTNPGLAGEFTFKTNINSGDSRLLDSIKVEYQYSILTATGGAASYGWADWETVPVTATSPSYDFTYTFKIADLNEFYIGDDWVTTGLNGRTQINRDENETRLTAYFKDGTTARSPKLTFTYPTRLGGRE